MSKKIITIIFIFISSFSYSQVSGYMGNKFSFIYSAGMSFPHITGYGTSQIKPIINHSFALEYIYGNTSAVLFKYKYASNLFKNISYDDNLNQTNFYQFKNYTFSSHTFGLYNKFYRKNSLAPIGSYAILGIGIQSISLTNFVSLNSNTNSLQKKDISQFDIIFNYGFGRNWIMFDRILIGFQAETSLPLLSTINNYINIGETPSLYNNDSNYIILNRINYINELLRVSLNIGFISF